MSTHDDALRGITFVFAIFRKNEVGVELIKQFFDFDIPVDEEMK